MRVFFDYVIEFQTSSGDWSRAFGGLSANSENHARELIFAKYNQHGDCRIIYLSRRS